jgi:hypothetical protein
MEREAYPKADCESPTSYIHFVHFMQKTYRQTVIALDDMSYGISTNDIMVGPIIKREVGARVWERPKTDRRISVEKRRMLSVV